MNPSPGEAVTYTATQAAFKVVAVRGIRASLTLLGMALALTLFSVWASPQAQAKTSVSVTPSLLELESNPGSRGEQTVTIANDGDEPFAASVYAKEYPRATEEQSAEEWLQITPERISVKPGEKQDITVSMKVPLDADIGGYYALISLLTDAKATEGGSGTATSGEVGVPLHLSVQGPEPLTKEASVSGIVPRLLDDGKVGFQILVENSGDEHFFPQGKLTLSDEDGKKLNTLEVPESTAIIPGTEKLIDVIGALTLEAGRSYTARTALQYGGESPATSELTFTPETLLEIQELDVEEQEGGLPNLRMLMANQGELAVKPRVRLDVFNTAGLVGSAAPDQAVELAPDEEKEIDAKFPARLGPGEYILMAKVVYGDGETLEEQTTFTIDNPAPESEQPGAPEAPVGTDVTNWWMVVGVPLAGILLLIAAIYWLPQLGPARKRIKRAWKAFGQSE